MAEYCIAGFGEVMLRLCPTERHRFAQAFPGVLDATFGGGEANVCASVAMLGGKSRYLTALPDNPIARAFENQLRGFGCDTSKILFTNVGRMGVYYAEHGSNMRGSNVVYDRDGSSIALLPPEAYDFPKMLAGVTHLHLTGITPSLSKNAYESTLALAECAHRIGTITISIDLNYRKKLWNWEPGTAKNDLANRCMSKIVEFADIIIGNEEDASDVFGIKSENSSIEEGQLNVKGYEEVAAKLSARFPKCRYVAITLRESISANHNNWGGMLYCCQEKKAYFAPMNGDKYEPYEIRDIVDRFGGGDSFCAGLLTAMYTPELFDPQTIIRFAVAASALKHTIHGDYNFSSRKEVEALMKGSASGRVQR